MCSNLKKNALKHFQCYAISGNCRTGTFLCLCASYPLFGRLMKNDNKELHRVMVWNELHQSCSHSSSLACFTNTGIRTDKGSKWSLHHYFKKMAAPDHTFSLEKIHDATNTHDQKIVFSKHNRTIATVLCVFHLLW